MNNKNKKILALGLCSIMCITNVGCSSLGKKESKKKVETNVDLSNIKDIRTVKVNQDQAMLRFTTQNKAGSISSLILKEKDGKYIYSIDGIDKKGQGIIMTPSTPRKSWLITCSRSLTWASRWATAT